MRRHNKLPVRSRTLTRWVLKLFYISIPVTHTIMFNKPYFIINDALCTTPYYKVYICSPNDGFGYYVGSYFSDDSWYAKDKRKYDRARVHKK